MAIVLRAIRTAAEWAANQTAMEAIYGVGNYYTTLTAWEAAIPADLVAADEQHVAQCYDDWPTGLDDYFTIADRTTDATRNVVIDCPVAERHGGSLSSGFLLKHDTDWQHTITVDSGDVTIKNIRVSHDGSGACVKLDNATAENILLDSIILTSTDSSGSTTNVNDGLLSVYAGWSEIINSILRGGSIGISVYTWRTVNAYNNTIIDCKRGTYTKSTNNVNDGDFINNVSACTEDDFIHESSFSAGSTNNASKDISATTASIGTVTGISLTDGVDFTEPSTDDYTITSGSALIDEGSDLSGQFTIDIAGTVRG